MAVVITIMFSLTVRALQRESETEHGVCLSMHHFTIVFYTFTLVVVMVLYSGYLLVAREISAEGPNSPSSKRITVWDVSNLVETWIGLSIFFLS